MLYLYVLLIYDKFYITIFLLINKMNKQNKEICTQNNNLHYITKETINN